MNDINSFKNQLIEYHKHHWDWIHDEVLPEYEDEGLSEASAWAKGGRQALAALRGKFNLHMNEIFPELKELDQQSQPQPDTEVSKDE